MMKPSQLFAALLMALVFTTASAASAQGLRSKGASGIVNSLKPGQWVEIEGVAQRDLSVLCMELEVISGDFHDGDWEFGGMVRSVSKEKKQFFVLGIPVRFRNDTEFENSKGTFKSFDDVRPGQYLEVEGTFLKDGSFMATEVDDETAKLVTEPEIRREFECTGRIDKTDVSSGTITVMGVTFKLTDKTELKSVLK